MDTDDFENSGPRILDPARLSPEVQSPEPPPTKKKDGPMQELTFDHVFHLAGDQVIPNYMGVTLCEAKHHHLVVTDKTAPKLGDLRAGLSKDIGSRISPVHVSATDYSAIYAVLRETVSRLPHDAKIGFNITGGTKPMSVAALDICREYKSMPFYIDTQDRQIRVFSEPFLQLALPAVFESVDQFLVLAGYQVKQSGYRPDALLTPSRRRLLKEFWKNRNGVRQSIQKFAEATNKQCRDQRQPPDVFRQALDDLKAFSASRSGSQYLMEYWHGEFRDCETKWQDAAVFAAGCWLEEWLMLQFHDANRSDVYRDIQQGLHLSVRADVRKERDIQDIDLVFTDGYTLTLVECKCGKYDQEKVQKLENLRMSLGGSFGRGILAAINPPEDVLADRIRLGSLSLVCEQALEKLPQNFANIKQGRIYHTPADYLT